MTHFFNGFNNDKTHNSRNNVSKSHMTLNNYFQKVYVINLQIRPDRLIKQLEGFKHIGVKPSVFTAINGYQEPHIKHFTEYSERPLDKGTVVPNPEGKGTVVPNPVNQNNVHPLELKYNKKLINSPGAWGYLLTWKAIIEDAMSQGIKNFICFDDDVLFCHNFNRKLEVFMSRIPTDWYVVMLGATQLVQHRSPITQGNWFRPNITDGSFATAVSENAYPIILESIDQMNCAFDSGPMRDIYRRFPTKCYVAHPHLVIADVRDSNIREGRNLEKFAKSVDWDLKQFNVYGKKPNVPIVLILYCKETAQWIDPILSSFSNPTYSAVHLVLIDDNSSDDTYDIISEWKSLHPERVSVIRNQQSIGVKTSRTLAEKRYKGNHTFFIRAQPIKSALDLNRYILSLIISYYD
jgi:GR25 family glycosyltransferase involved in LPS biosynthesis